jgi:hypothetical protein
MKRSSLHRRPLILVAGTLIVLASIAWGAAYHPHARVSRTAATSSTAPRPAVAATAPTAAVTAPTAAVTPVRATVEPTPAAGQAGMRIFRDPETGEIGPPTAENAAAIAREAGEPVDNAHLPVVRLPNGGYELLIDGKIEDAMVMTIDKKGNRVVKCVQNDPTAHQQEPALAPAPAREDR